MKGLSNCLYNCPLLKRFNVTLTYSDGSFVRAFVHAQDAISAYYRSIGINNINPNKVDMITDIKISEVIQVELGAYHDTI